MPYPELSSFIKGSDAVIANGSILNDYWFKGRLNSFSNIVAVDGGLSHLDRIDFIPQLIIGDFDSASKNLLERYSDVDLKRFSSEKDETDLELALLYLLEGSENNVTIFGGMGGRVDHQLGNLNLISRYPKRAFVETENEFIFVVNDLIQFSIPLGTTISLIPVNGTVSNVCTKGFKWELEEQDLNKTFIGISNVAISTDIEIAVGEGDLMVCVNRIFFS